MIFQYQYFQPEADADGRTILSDFELGDEAIFERPFQPVFRGTMGKFQNDGSEIPKPATEKDFMQIAELAFMIHNADDRPRGQEIRSMSVGDVVLVTGDGIQEALQVDGIGFRTVEVVEIDHRLRVIR